METMLTCYEDLQYDAVAPLFSDESIHTPSFHFSDPRSSVRRNVFSLLSHAKMTYDIDPFLSYLALNYVDRFLSEHEILEKRPWISHILVPASLSLAAKMTAVDLSVSLSDLQREQGFEFDASSVDRMEKILLAALQWRMRSITPFSFLRYFISVSEIRDPSLAPRLSRRASDTIFNVQRESMFMDFKPSIVAASALLCSIQELTPDTFSSSRAAISSCDYVNNDALVECVGAMQEIISEPSLLHVPSDTLTPMSVLDGPHTSEEAASSSRR